MKTLLQITLVSTLTFMTGCFYLVPEGQGGVAERFPLSNKEKPLQNRIAQCAEKLDQQDELIRRTVLFHTANSLLIQSRRLYEAELFKHAEHPLSKAEQILQQLAQQKALLTAQNECNENEETCL